MSDMTTEAMRDLVDTLYEKTQDRKLAWKKGFDDQSAEATFANNVVRLIKTRGPDDKEMYYIALTDRLGDVIDTIFAYEIKDAGPPPGEFNSYWQLFEHLYKSAMRQASGVDKVIRDILSELKES